MQDQEIQPITIQTSAERPERFSDKKEVYWFDYSCIESEDEKCINIERFGEHYSIEKDILKPYFKPTKASEKGIRESLVIVDSLAFIVNVPNKTVVTAMDRTESDDNIYTNIDGAVII